MDSTNLPIQLTSFIGREQEITDVQQLLSNSHLVTLTGAGGSGKTRLAIQIAHTVSKTFADGVWLVELATLHQPELVPQYVTLALGLRPIADQPLLETLQRFVQSKQLLLILDNCEHLSAACAQLAYRLLSQASDLRILATSRTALAIAGETIYPLSGLAQPVYESEPERDRPSSFDLQELMAYDAIRLFVERARAVSPRFNLTAENRWSIVELCKRLDGLPLALELASARVNVLTIAEIVTRLNHRLSLLISPKRRDLEPRHQSLRAAIDWSYALLTPDEQILLRRLAVFEAGCTLEQARAICIEEEVAHEYLLDWVASLVNNSLVVADTSGRAQARYRLLETIREYALEKLDGAGETPLLRNRHLDLFLAKAEEIAPKLNDAYQQLWLNWLEGEHDNLRAALGWALVNGRIEAGLRLATALIRFWEIRGYVHEGLTWFQRLFAQTDEKASPVVHAQALAYASFLAMFLGDAASAMAYGQKAVALAEAAGDEGSRVLTIALSSLASGARAAGDYHTAFALETRVIQLLRESSERPFFLGMALLAHGSIAIELGDYDTARASLDESLAIAREAGDAFRIAHALIALGDLARCEQRYADAQTAYENSALLLRELDAQHDLASVLHNLGHTCLHLGNIERAYPLFRESLTAHQLLHNMSGMAECLTGFAAIALLQGLPSEGTRLLGAADALGGRRTATASVWQATRMEYDHYFTLARTNLTEVELQAELTIGRAMSLAQAVDLAQNLPVKPEIAPATKETSDGLTNREREVAALIGQGKTNGEIATELVLSKRTVETHISHILSKLELTSRAQIMLWAIEHGLT